MNYYNDNDKGAVKWIKYLIKNKLIPDGEVDDRSIKDVIPGDLDGFIQCHFFAGIGGWSYALQLAAWPDNKPVWTGSCPCQPFSVAGQGKAEKDDRHLWPYFRQLIKESNPQYVFGEQVASKLRREWLAGVQTDMEAMGFIFGAADIPACSVGAPHIRQRLWWMAHAEHAQRWQETAGGNDDYREDTGREKEAGGSISCGAVDNGLADTQGKRRHGTAELPEQNQGSESEACCRLGNAESNGWREKYANSERRYEGIKEKGLMQRPWDYFRIVQCLDGKQRRVPEAESAFPVVADGISGRVVLLRGIGNSIVP